MPFPVPRQFRVSALLTTTSVIQCCPIVRSPWEWQTRHDGEVRPKVVSMASCAPCHRVRPCATTSRRRPCKLLNSAKSISRTWRLVETRAPASLHTWAAGTSNGQPLLPNTPATAHAAQI